MTPRSKDLLHRLWRDTGGAAAIEFAIVAVPLLWMILGICQMGLYYYTQSSLDAAVTTTLENLRNSFTTTTPTFPSAGTLKSNMVNNSGGLIVNDSTLAVEIQPLTALTSSVVAIADGTNNYGTTTSVLVLRAEANVLNFTPGFGSLMKVRSSGLVRRQGR